MPKLYIANCTRFEHVFNIRVPEVSKLLRIEISSGHQRTFPLDLNKEQTEYVVRQLERYGAKPRAEVHGKLNDFISGVVYSLDRPLNEDEIVAANEDQIDAAQNRSVRQAVRLAQVAELAVHEGEDGKSKARGKRLAKSVEVEVLRKDSKNGQEEPMMGIEFTEQSNQRIRAM